MFKNFLVNSTRKNIFLRCFHQPKVLVVPQKTEEKSNPNENSFKFLSKEINESLKLLGISEASEIQQLAIPTILKGKNTLFAAQTGTGKTLAYLLPILQLIKKNENESKAENRPSAIILVPSKELVSQVLSVMKSFSHIVKFTSAGLRSDFRMKRLKNSLSRPIDIVVTTPGILTQLSKKKLIYYSKVKHLVLDEADSLLAKGFEENVVEDILVPLKKKMKTKNENTQFIFCLATFNQSIQKFIEQEFNDVSQIKTTNLHKTIKNVKHRFIEMNGRDKLKEVEKLLKEDDQRTLIFCNTIQCCRAVEHYLNEKGFNVTNFHSNMPPELKEQEFQRFVSGSIKILVTTDIASRGLDTLNVYHVILFDFPESSVEYIHRSGRTGRMGQKGKVTSLLQKKEFELGKLIQNAISSGQNLDKLSSDKKTNKIWMETQAKERKEKREQMGKRKEYMMKKLFSKRTNSKEYRQKTVKKSYSTKEIKEVFKS
eukprot:gene10319-2735_t